VETKVTASTTTAAVVVLIMWALSRLPGVDDLPVEVQGAVLVLVTGSATIAAGWLAPHTTRRSERGGEHRA
jgi:hypothetical protein